MSLCLFVHNLIWRFSKFDQFSKRTKNNTGPKYRAKIVVIFSPLLSINLHYCRDLKKCASLFVIPSFDKILHNVFRQFIENWNLFLE